MRAKAVALLHAAAGFAIFFLTDSFSYAITGRLFRICGSVIFIAGLHICLSILSVWMAVRLYSKYILKMSLPELYLGKPLPSARWCAAAVAALSLLGLLYFAFTNGKFGTGQSAVNQTMYALFYAVFGAGLKSAVTEGILFRGLLVCVLRNGFGKKGGILISSLFYAVAGLIPHISFAWTGADDLWMFLPPFLMGLELGWVTCETGSVWTSVAIHALYNAFWGDGAVLQIGTGQEYNAVFTYTVEGECVYFVGTLLPVISYFVAIFIMKTVLKQKGIWVEL